jgi:hypothetical protein
VDFPSYMHEQMSPTEDATVRIIDEEIKKVKVSGLLGL